MKGREGESEGREEESEEEGGREGRRIKGGRVGRRGWIRGSKGEVSREKE